MRITDLVVIYAVSTHLWKELFRYNECEWESVGTPPLSDSWLGKCCSIDGLPEFQEWTVGEHPGRYRGGRGNFLHICALESYCLH